MGIDFVKVFDICIMFYKSYGIIMVGFWVEGYYFDYDDFYKYLFFLNF